MNRKFVYCHFSFKRPRNKNYGLFSVALYADADAKVLVAQKTLALKLWKNQQYITAIQSYENAMSCLYEWQHKLKAYGVTNILLVTDNSVLAGWIENPKKNKAYTELMLKATYPYRLGSYRELIIPLGICEPRKEKSRKYCREDLVVNKSEMESMNIESGANRDDILSSEVSGIKTALDILTEMAPEGIEELKEVSTVEE